MPRDAARCREMPRDATRCSGRQRGASFCSRMPHCGCLCCLLTGWLGGVRSQLKVASVAHGDAQCVRRWEGVCARALWLCAHCGRLAAAGGGKCALCVALRWRATRACCARVRVGSTRASALLRLRARRCVLCGVLCCAPVCCAVQRRLAGRAARRAAARCGCSRACLMVYRGRSARPTGSSAAQGASMRTALHVRLHARLACKFPCGEGRAYVFTLRARAGAEGGAVSPRSEAGWSSA